MQPRQPLSRLSASNEARITALEVQVQNTVSDVARLATIAERLSDAVSSVTATANALTTADAGLAARVSVLESNFAIAQEKRLQLVQEYERRISALQSSIDKSVTTALKDARDNERFKEDRESVKVTADKSNAQLTTLFIGSVAMSLLTVLFTVIFQLVVHH